VQYDKDELKKLEDERDEFMKEQDAQNQKESERIAKAEEFRNQLELKDRTILTARDILNGKDPKEQDSQSTKPSTEKETDHD
jgi:hypothetical protein